MSRLSDEDSDAYFATRAPAAQLGAWASPQSRPIGDRDELERRLEETEQRFAGKQVERPPHWGGYLLEPETVEFWQGQIARLHDRFRYSRAADGSWELQRLAP